MGSDCTDTKPNIKGQLNWNVSRGNPGEAHTPPHKHTKGGVKRYKSNIGLFDQFLLQNSNFDTFFDN